jgi:hypothetical protein
MADFSATTWKEQDSANTAPSPNGFPTGAAPSTLHPSLRNLTGASVRAYRRINAFYAATGTATALVLTPEQAVTAYVKGERWAFFPNVTNTGAMTLNISSLGAKSILRADGTALVSGDIGIGQFCELYYDGSAFRVVSGAGNKFTGNVTAGSLTAGTISGDGAAISNMNASELKSGTLHNDRLVGNYNFAQLNLSGPLYAPTAVVQNDSNSTLSFRTAADNKDKAVIGANAARDFFVNVYNSAGSLQRQLVIPQTGNMHLSGDTVWTAANDGAGSTLDADLLDGYQAASLYRNNADFSTTGNLVISNSAPRIDLTDTTAGSYNTRIVVDSNNWYLQKQADGATTWTTFMQFEMDTTNAYANGSQIMTDARITAAYLNTTYGFTPPNSNNQVIAGNGLTGGGTIAANRTITLGTPTSITATSTNSVSTTGHTHDFDFNSFVYTGSSASNTTYPIGTVIQVDCNNGPTATRNASMTIYIRGSDNYYYTSVSSGNGGTLAGTWRSRGGGENGRWVNMQRTA